MHRKRFEFLSQSMHDRPKYLQEAVSGGSVPPGYLAELSELASSTGRLAIEVRTLQTPIAIACQALSVSCVFIVPGAWVNSEGCPVTVSDMRVGAMLAGGSRHRLIGCAHREQQ